MTTPTPTQADSAPEEQNMTTDLQELVSQTRGRILHALEIFPFLSSSMIHICLGTATSTKLWKPILEDLVADGQVILTQHTARTPLNRTQTYDIYHLPQNPYPYIFEQQDNLPNQSAA